MRIVKFLGVMFLKYVMLFRKNGLLLKYIVDYLKNIVLLIFYVIYVWYCYFVIDCMDKCFCDLMFVKMINSCVCICG